MAVEDGNKRLLKTDLKQLKLPRKETENERKRKTIKEKKRKVIKENKIKQRSKNKKKQ